MQNAVRILVSILLVVSVISCQKEVSKETGTGTPASGGGGTGGGTTTPGFTAKIDGTTLTPTTLTAQNASGFITITAMQTAATSAKAVIIIMPDDITPGTYSLTESGTYQATYAGGSGMSGSIYLSSSGTLVITEHNTTTKTIKGTFQFTGVDALGAAADVQVTAGSFTVIYQ